LERKKRFFVFFFSNSKLLHNEQLHDYSRKSKKTIFLNNICLTCNFAELILFYKEKKILQEILAELMPTSAFGKIFLNYLIF